jgi:hypothetical protein
MKAPEINGEPRTNAGWCGDACEPGQEVLSQLPDPPRDEIWREIPGWEGYYSVSSTGQVMSLPRTVPVQNQVSRKYGRGRVLRPAYRASDGRKMVFLYRAGKGYGRTVEQLMRDAGFST